MTELFNQDSKIVYYIVLCAALILFFSITMILFLYFSSKKLLKNKLRNKELELNYLKGLHKTTLLLQEERERISSELHDDIGSALSTIHFQSVFLMQEINNPEHLNVLKEIGENTQQISKSLQELVWSLNSKQDTLESFVIYVKDFFYKYFEFTSITTHFQSSLILDDIVLTSIVRRNLFLAIKEIFHNTLKHSSASTIYLDLKYDESHLHIAIVDDGKGFPADIKYGNGIINIRKRIELISGRIDFFNNSKGVQINIVLPLSF